MRRGVLVDELGFAGIGLHPGHQLLELVRRQILLGDHELRIDRDQPDRLEVLLQVVVQIVDDAADVGVPLADVDGVAVGRSARDAPDRDAAAGAADVLDDDRLAEDRPHLLGHDAGRDVGRAARRERHHQRDLAGRIGLRLRPGESPEQRQCGYTKPFRHVRPPVAISLPLMLAALMIGHHFSISAFCKAASASGVC